MSDSGIPWIVGVPWPKFLGVYDMHVVSSRGNNDGKVLGYGILYNRKEFRDSV